MNENGIRFHPIQCSSIQFFNKDQPLEFHDGEIYFLTDTRQIYLIKNNQAVEMCGGTNIIYGIKKIEHINDGHEQNPNVLFAFEDIESDVYPVINDLILNTDGCFYKVIDIQEDGFYTKRITLSGTGSYVPGGDSSIGGTGYSLTTDFKNYVYSSTADEMLVNFTANYLGSEDNAIVYIGFSFDTDLSSEGAVVFYEIDTETYGFNIEHPIDLIDYRHLFTSSARIVYLNTEDAYGRKRSAKISIKLVDLFLKTDYNDILNFKNNIEPYSCEIGGAISGISNKKLTFSFYAPGDDIHPYDTYDIDLNVTDLKNYPCDIDTSKLQHGSYTMKVVMTAQISGTQKVISSNILTHKVIKFDSSNNSAILTYIFPNKVETYVNNELSYFLATEENRQYTLKIILNGVEYQELQIESNSLKSYPLYFEIEGTYDLTLLVSELGVKQSSLVTVVKYAGEIPYINPYDKALQLYLTPQGHSNDSVQNEYWNDYLNRSHASLIDVNFNQASGWLLDKNNISYLQLTSGGKLELTDYSPFKTDPTAVLENSKQGRGLTIELDFEINGITDYDANLIEWTSQSLENNLRNVGLIVKGNSASFYSQQRNGIGTQGALTKIALTEGVRTRLSFVLDPKISQDNLEEYNNYFPMCYTYLNGILSNAVIYDKTDSFSEHSSYPAHLNIDSTHGSIKIYGIRVYNKTLGSREILNNYIASLPTLDDRLNVYEDNKVFDGTGENIDFNIVSSKENYNLKIPYMVLTGGYSTDAENDKWRLKEAKLMGSPGLPTGKKDYRLVDVKVVYPDTPYFKQYGGYKNYEFINKFNNDGWITDNFGNAPINGGCIMYAQGTSSMEYPVKNLRLRFNKVKKEIDGEVVKSKENYFTVRPDIEPVEIICMKADYMESSGSHNTGAANLIDDLYKTVNLQTPGQEHFNSSDNTIVTCIKGHPCLIFYSPTGEPNTYQYIGKYNLNLDKATPDPFGFNHDDNFGWLSEGDAYWEVQYADKKQNYKDPFVGQLEPDEGADYVPNQRETEVSVQAGDKVNSIHCFEFLDNAVSVCNFLRKPKKYVDDGNGNLIPDPTGGYYSYEETWYNEFINNESKKVPGWALGFESRYPEDRVGYHDADMLYELASWINELYYLKTEGSEDTGSPSQKDIDEANARFKNEYELYFNKDFLLFYYIVTEALLMADNRVKNMMIATWGRSSKSYTPLTYSANNEWIVDETAEPIETNFFEWYPIFYDMDTMLGLDNTGVDKFKYYDEDTDPSIYNGDEVLWNFVRDNLDYELNIMYRNLETLLNTNKDQNGNWAPESVIPYFNENQATMANEAFYNGDAVYKYLNPARLGYKDLLNNKDIKPGDAPYLYAAQGTRELARENFLINRLKFLAGKRNGQQFLNGDQVEFRWNFPSPGQGYYYAEVDMSNFNYEANKYYYFYEDEDSEGYVLDSSPTVTTGRKYFEYKTDNKLSESASKVSPSIDFVLTALQPCYAGILLGKNGNVYKERFAANQEQIIKVPEGSSANNTEAYLLGLSSLKSLNLANKYVQKFVMSGENKLEELILGHPNKYYYNPYWSSDTSAARISLTGSTYLQKFNLQNCVSFRSALDFSPCPIINTILLTGSSVSAITLPRNGNLIELRLPVTIKNLIIDSHKQLQANKFSIGDYYYYDNQGQVVDEIGEGRYMNDYSQLQHIEIIDTPIDTYSMVKGASQLSSYYLENINWVINSLDDVTIDKKGFVNGFKVLDTLLTKQAKKGEKLLSHIANTPGADGLSGVIKIAIPNINIDEYDIQNKYGNKFPNLKFEFDKDVIGNGYKKAYKIEFFAIPGATEPYYVAHVKQTDNPTQTLEDLTVNLSTPFKEPTLYDQYDFTHIWEIIASDDDNFVVGNKINEMSFKDIIPQCNLKLVAEFARKDRPYSVNFYDHNGQNPILVDTYTYDQILAENSKTVMYSYKQHPDDQDLNTQSHNRYSFKGWISEIDFYNWKNSGKTPTEFIDLYSTKITYDDMKLYPYHVEESCKTLIPNYDLFTFITKSIDGVDKYIINVKPEYWTSLQGSLVIPSADQSGRAVEMIGHICPSSDLIYKIYFQPNNQLTHIGGAQKLWPEMSGVSAGLYDLSTLKYIYFPKDQFNNLKNIGEYAFYYDISLEVIENLPNSIEYIGASAFEGNGALKLDTLPTSLKKIDSRAFCWCRSITINKIPLGVTDIPNGAFSYCDNLQITTFGRNGDIPVGFENNVTTIDELAFAGASDAYVKIVSKIILGKSLTTIDSTAFQDFGFIPRSGTEGNYTAEELRIELDLYTPIITDSNYTTYFTNQYITTSDIKS